MNKSEKNQAIDALVAEIDSSPNFYLTDISTLNAEDTYKLRSICFKRDVKLHVVKNTLLRKALERASADYDQLYPVLKGSTSIMFTETGNVPAKLIKEFRKKSSRPLLKGAWVGEGVFIGDDSLNVLENIKSKNELIADIIALLQSPAKNVISGLQTPGRNLAGILKTLSEKGA
ncbi:MAG: 50S ribosomal protein L10 [Flavobacteriales bacterium]|nr:50S ribosomal protein L10 [Flavobacteriales bacterium]